MDDAKAQLLERLKTANTVLVTVSRNPSVDQLAACIGLTLVINKLNKHASAVFSGTIPSTIEFLKPEQTIEKTTDSLRDFIIALDKNKADKLRYKVEDEQVKIFITPYKVSLSQSDLEFSQGDLNVELVVAIGVQKQDDLDQAIVAHGRILHDATIACINTVNVGNIGTINWLEPTASSLCELVSDLAFGLGDKLVDEQIATALLTGIIAETERFSNQKTTSQVMSVSGRLMAAGANQQLVTNELSIQAAVSTNESRETSAGDLVSNDGTLSINHKEDPLLPEASPQAVPQPPIETNPEPPVLNETPQITPINEVKDTSAATSIVNTNAPRLVTEPPTLGGTLTSNSSAAYYDPSTDPLSNITLPSDDDPIRSKAPNLVKPPEDTEQIDSVSAPAPYTPPPADWQPPVQAPPPEPEKPQALPQTLSDLEQEVGSPHLNDNEAALKDSRDKIDNILSEPKDKPDEAPKPEEKVVEAKDDASNTTGLDPSLFSEPPSDSDSDSAPPVPPPLPPITT